MHEILEELYTYLQCDETPLGLAFKIWPLFLTRELALERRVPASKEAVLSLVQDPETVIRLNPRIVDLVQDTSDETQPEPDMAWYTVAERVSVGCGQTMAVRFRVLWGRVPGGANLHVFAGMGTELKQEWRVLEVERAEGEDGEVVVYEEKVVIQGLFLFMPFIVSSARKGHTTMLDIIAERVLHKED